MVPHLPRIHGFGSGLMAMGEREANSSSRPTTKPRPKTGFRNQKTSGALRAPETSYALAIFPLLMQLVHTRIRFGAPFTSALTACRFTFQRRRVTLWACEMLLPNCGPVPQTSHICAIALLPILDCFVLPRFPALKCRLPEAGPSISVAVATIAQKAAST